MTGALGSSWDASVVGDAERLNIPMLICASLIIDSLVIVDL
jgi:hypothetical protein